MDERFFFDRRCNRAKPRLAHTILLLLHPACGVCNALVPEISPVFSSEPDLISVGKAEP